MSLPLPRLFISYSWSSSEHEAWVLSLATELVENGVDVILDKWHLKEGHDSIAFMEQTVSDPAVSKVIIVCDRQYADKADDRSGGVGTETQIISPKIYAKRDQDKFVAVLSEKDDDGKPCLPTYYSSRIYIDLSDESQYAVNFDQLLRWIFDKPLHVRPEIGRPPSFITDSDSAIHLATSTSARRVLDAIRTNKGMWPGALQDYFSQISRNLEQFRISQGEGEFDERVVENIETFLSYRNEIVEVLITLSQYIDSEEVGVRLHRFLEQLYPYTQRPESVTTSSNWDFDNFGFIVHEIFLYAVASLLKHEQFGNVGYLLRNGYYVGRAASDNGDGIVPFSRFGCRLTSLIHRNQRLGLRRLSLHADMLESRSHASGVDFSYLMQADFALYMRDCLDCIRGEDGQYWWPETLLYSGRQHTPFEVFARSQSSMYFENIKILFDISSKEDFVSVFEAYQSQALRVPRWEFESFNPSAMLGYEKLCSRP